MINCVHVGDGRGKAGRSVEETKALFIPGTNMCCLWSKHESTEYISSHLTSPRACQFTIYYRIFLSWSICKYTTHIICRESMHYALYSEIWFYLIERIENPYVAVATNKSVHQQNWKVFRYFNIYYFIKLGSVRGSRMSCWSFNAKDSVLSDHIHRLHIKK